MRRLHSSTVTIVKLSVFLGVVALAAPAGAHAQSVPPEIVLHPNEPARQPFQDSWGVPFNEPGDGEVVVPPGKRFVLEFTSLDVTVDTDCRVGFVSITTTAGGKTAGHHVPIASHVEFGTRNIAVTGQPLRLYGDPGTTMFVNFGGAGLNCNPIGALGASGYFVDVP